MAERPDEKPEERPDHDSTGGVKAYVSVDEAWALALQQARDNPEFYGRYAEQELSWDVISSDEIEDYYEVRLAYKTAGGFRTSGIEQLNIDKTGAIKSRQIIRQTHLSHGFIAASISLVLVVVMGAIFGGLRAARAQHSVDPTFATNAPAVVPVEFSMPLATTVSIAPETAACLVSSIGQVTIDVDAKTVDVPTTLTYLSLFPLDIPVLPANVTDTSKVFELSTETPLLKLITLTMSISTSDTALAAGNPDNIVILVAVGQNWIPWWTLKLPRRLLR